MIATFFGHRDAPTSIQPKLKEVLIELIESNKAMDFYVGCQGRFDAMVIRTLKELKKIYPHIQYSIVLVFFILTSTLSPTQFCILPSAFCINKAEGFVQCLVSSEKHSHHLAEKDGSSFPA